MDLLKNYINGSWVKSREDNTVDVINPATQEVMGKVPYGTKTSEDFGQAVDAASEAFKSWSQEPVMKRVQPREWPPIKSRARPCRCSFPLT